MHDDDRESQTSATSEPATPEPAPLEYGIVKVMHNKTSIMVTIPKVWARALHWHAGDHVRQELHDGNLLLINLDAPERIAKLQRSQGGEDAAPATS